MKSRTKAALCLLVVLCACGAEPQETATMRVTTAPGEFSAPNELTAPPGAALRAVNVVVEDPNEYATHPGLEALPLWEGHPITAFTNWTSGTIVAHSESTGKLAYLSGGVWTEITGSYNAPDGEVMDFETMQGALYFTTSTGLWRIVNVGVDPEPCGMVQALTGTGTTTGASGFLPEGFATAYRWHWAKNVDNGTDEGRLVEGAPGDRLVIINATGSTSSKDVSLAIPIPEDLPEQAFLRVFRSDAVSETILPTDEVRQVYEREPNAGELAAGEFMFTDSVPDAVRGPSAYYSANTGDGIGSSYYQAPMCRTLEVFHQSLFGACVTGVQRLTLTLIGTDTTLSSNVLAMKAGDRFFISDGVTEEEYRAMVAENFPDEFEIFTAGTPSQNVANTVNSLIRAINSRSGGLVYAQSTDTDGSNPGGFVVTARALNTGALTFRSEGTSQPFLPRLKSYARAFTPPGTNMSRTGGVTTVVVSTGMGYMVGQQVELYYPTGVTPDPNFPVGVYTVATTVPNNSFTYADPLPDAVGVADVYAFRSTDDNVVSSTGTAENAFAWGEEEQPDHWPLTNYGTVGKATARLQWSLAMDRYIFMGSEDGLFRVQGNATDGFGVVDNGVWNDTYRFIGRRTVAKLAGRGYALTRTNIVSWSETAKPQPVDGPIQEEIRSLLASHADNLAEYAYFVSDEVNKRLYVWVTTTPGGTKPDRAHILNVATGAWTRIDSTFPGLEDGTQGPGIAPPELGGQLHLLPTNAVDGELLRVRTTATAADYQGPEGEAIPSSVQYLPWTAGEPERQKMWTHVKIFTRAPTTQLLFAMATDMWPPVYEQTLPDMGPLWITEPEPVSDPVRGLAWKSLVGQNHMRAHAASFKVSHETAGERFRLLGLDVQHRAYGP